MLGRLFCCLSPRQQGHAAEMEGVHWTQNPHPPGSDARVAWQRGWLWGN